MSTIETTPPQVEFPAAPAVARRRESAAEAKTTSQRIWEAIMDLFHQEQVVTRETLCEVTGLRLSIIDDHVGRMVDNEQLRRVRSGVFVPIPRMDPPRPVSGSLTTDGFFVLEVGDQVLVMQPREARQAGALLSGQFMQFTTAQLGHDLNLMVNNVHAELKQLKRDLGGS